MYYTEDVLKAVKELLNEDGNHEYQVLVAKTLNNELREIVIAPYKKR